MAGRGTRRHSPNHPLSIVLLFTPYPPSAFHRAPPLRSDFMRERLVLMCSCPPFCTIPSLPCPRRSFVLSPPSPFTIPFASCSGIFYPPDSDCRLGSESLIWGIYGRCLCPLAIENGSRLPNHSWTSILASRSYGAAPTCCGLPPFGRSSLDSSRHPPLSHFPCSSPLPRPRHPQICRVAPPLSWEVKYARLFDTSHPSSSFIPAPLNPSLMAPPTHNPDDEMSLVDEDLQLDGEELHLDELPAITLAPSPAADETPAAKKVCVGAPPSAPGPSAPANNVPVVFAPAPTGAASGSPAGVRFSAIAAPSTPSVLNRPPSPTTPLASASQGAGIVLTAHAPAPAPTRNLRRPRPGPVMPHHRLAVVSLLMPEAGADAIRADLIARITAMLKPHFFRRGSVPEFEVATGEALRVPRRAYARLCFSWPTEEEADDFKRLFPRSISLNSSRSVLLKVFEDRNPGFTAAKAGGAATLSLRNIPPGYTPEDVRDFLLNGADPSEPGWLADLQFFHRTTDPYEEVFLSVFTGIPLPLPDDPSFSRIPAVIPFEDGSPPALLNVSTHVCAFCGNKHRDSDHETFAFKRKQRLNNKAHICVAQLQQTNGTPFCPALPFPFSPTHLLVFCCPRLSVSLASSLAIVSFPLATLLCSAIDMLRPFDPLLAIFCPYTAPPCPLPPFPPLLSRTSILWSLLAFPLCPPLRTSPTHSPLPLHPPPLSSPSTALMLQISNSQPPLPCTRLPVLSHHGIHPQAPSVQPPSAPSRAAPPVPHCLTLTWLHCLTLLAPFLPRFASSLPPLSRPVLLALPPWACPLTLHPQLQPLSASLARDHLLASGFGMLSSCAPHCPLLPCLPFPPLFAIRLPLTPQPRPSLTGLSFHTPPIRPCPGPRLPSVTYARASPSHRAPPPFCFGLTHFCSPSGSVPFSSPPAFPMAAFWPPMLRPMATLTFIGRTSVPSASPHSLFLPLVPPPPSRLLPIHTAPPLPRSTARGTPGCQRIPQGPWPLAHTSNLRAAAKGPAAKEKYSNWRALTFLDIP
ncbi:unnamed protein product [Closterium sp. NIES-65]|nr:unnamed protein product [Closterium sp. NIES-65]